MTTSQTTVVKDRNGLLKEGDQLNRRAEHFKEILNRSHLEEEAATGDTSFKKTQMKRELITQQQIEETKGNGAPGKD